MKHKEIIENPIEPISLDAELSQTPEGAVRFPTLISPNFRAATFPGVPSTNIGTFGGDGSDGVLKITSGTTTLDLGAAEIFIKNYRSIAIVGTGKLAFSNPHAKGTIIILKSQKHVTIASSTAPCIDASGMGGAAAGADNDYIIDEVDHSSKAGAGSSGNSGGAGGAAGVIYSYLRQYSDNATKVKARKTLIFVPGAGGDTGGTGASGNGYPAVGGAGGIGGGALYIECGGRWTLTTANGISVAGKDGSVGTNQTHAGSQYGAGGGGSGGAGGMCVILYNKLVANTGSVTVTGGNGGNGGNRTDGEPGVANFGGGGGGAGSAGNNKTAGGAGGIGADPNDTGGNGETPSGGGTGGSGGTSTGYGGGGAGGAGGPVGSSIIMENIVFG